MALQSGLVWHPGIDNVAPSGGNNAMVGGVVGVRMVRAYVTVITGGGVSGEVAEAIREIAGVEGAHVVAGDFDVVAEIEGEDVLDLQKIVTAGIHDIEGVGTTRTYIQMD